MEPQLSSAVLICYLLPLILILLMLEQRRPHMFVAAVDATQTNNQNQLTVGSTMTSAQYLTSSSGDFVFGFYSSSGDPNNNMADQQLLLAIWYNLNNDGPPAATNNKTVVVWFAKDSLSHRTVVATRQSVVKFANSGRVSLVDGGGGGQSEIELWSPSGQQPLGSALVLQDSGNLQLISKDGVRWESFGDPTDTLLPGQNMSNSPGKYLQSRSTDTDFSPGRFTLNVQDDGNIVLYMKQLEVATDLGAPYWATTTFGMGKVPTLFFNDSGNLYYSFPGNESGAVNLTARRPLDSFQMYYHYAALDPDGTVRVYVHRKKNSTGGDGDGDGSSWDVFAHFLADGCSRRTNFGLQGMCGPNAFCTSSSSQGADEPLGCECPYGYEFLDERHRYKGCRPSFVPHACSDDGKGDSSDSEFVTKEVPYTSWSNQSTYKKFMLTPTTTLAHCNASCLRDCFCAAVLVDATSCMFVGMLTAGKAVAQQDAMTTLIKVGASWNASVPEDPLRPPAPASSTMGRIWLYVAICGIAVACLFACSTIYVLRRSSTKIRKQASRRSLRPPPVLVPGGPGLRVFSSEELTRATDNFQERLGRGSFGEVYLGDLLRIIEQGEHTDTDTDTDTGTTVRQLPPQQLVAVKKLNGSSEYSDKDFGNEVRSIGQIHHCNLVPMVGYCNEGDHRMLVFEYMPGGTLDKFIFGRRRPCWSCLADAAIGVAKGLEYLHEGCKPRIIHCDIKPDNILFDDVHVPRITDFGISKLLGDHMTQQTFRNTIAGTAPYIAPEWFRSTGKVGTMVDVYSFGVVLLEIICCKRAAGEQPANVQQAAAAAAAAAASGGLFSFPLRAWAEPLIRAGRADQLVVLGEAASTSGGTDNDDEEEEQVVDMESVLRFGCVAIWCLQVNPSARPTMRKWCRC